MKIRRWAGRLSAMTVMLWLGGASAALAQTSSFGPPVSYDSGNSTTGVAVADLNNDGFLDVIASAADSDSVRVRLGAGDGTFGPEADFYVGFFSGPYGIAVADFNNDGNPDIAVANTLSTTISVLFGDGTGTFSLPASQFSAGFGLQAIVAGDFNNDTKTDLAVTSTSDSTVTILLGLGNGSFVYGSDTPIPTWEGCGCGGFPGAIRAAYIDGDANLDLVVANTDGDTIRVLLGDGTGAFPPPSGGALADRDILLDPDDIFDPTPVDLAVLDLDGDGVNDLVVAAVEAGEVLLFKGVGDGTFIPHPDQPSISMLPGGPSQLTVADFNGDGILDVAAADVYLDQVVIFEGNGTFLADPGLPFTTRTFDPDPSSPLWLAAGDFNGDGKIDLAVGQQDSEDTAILLNETCCFVTVTVTGTGVGSVTSTAPPARIACPGSCVRAFDPGADVELQAVPAPGSLFTGWSGALCSGTGPCTVPAGTEAQVTATFDTLDVSPASVAGGTVGVSYSQALSATNGTPGYSFTLASGSLPPGVNLAGNLISGVPTQGGIFAFTIQGTDSGGAIGSRSYSITVAAASTLTSASAAAATYNAAAQNVNLSATVTSAGVVNAGTVTFTVRDGSSTVIGIPVGGIVAGGVASATYALPAGTPAQTLAITAVYTEAASYLTSSGTANLVVGPAGSSTAAVNTSTAFSPASQSVPLAASVTSPNGIVNAGTVTFTLMNGVTPVGSPVTSGAVSGGLATANYTLPGGTLPGTLTINASYNGSTNFTASSNATHTLNILAVATTTSATGGSATFSASPQSVPLSATVTSTGGTVNAGTVSFTVRTLTSAVIGSSVSGPVVAGAAAATYTLPGGTAAQTLIVTASFAPTLGFAGSEGTASLSVACTSLTVGPALPPAVRLGRPFSLTLTATGATDATFELTGTPPPGLTLSGATLSGTPTALGRFDVTATATSGACSGSQAYRLDVMRAPRFAVGAGAGIPRVAAFDNRGTLASSFFADDPSFGGGIRVAMADISGDGVDDIITAPGPGAATATVRVFDGASGALLRQFVAYPAAASGGLYVAAGDVNADGIPDIVVSRDGASPSVRVFDGQTSALLADFLAYPAGSVGGVRVAAGDVDGDGVAEIITGPQAGAPPEVRIFSGAGALRASFFAYDPLFMGGVYVAAGDVDGDGKADVVTGADAGGGPHVMAFSGADGHVLRSFFAYTPIFTGGVRVAVGDLDLDGHAEIITSPGPGGGPHVRVWDGGTGAEIAGFFADAPAFTGGLNIGAPSSPSHMAIDTPRPGATVSSSFTVSGWVTIAGATDDAGADAIHAWALPVAGGSPIFVGATTTFVTRSDIAAMYGGAFAEAGFNLAGGPLPAGTYDLVVYAHSARSGTWPAWRIVRIVVGP